MGIDKYVALFVCVILHMYAVCSSCSEFGVLKAVPNKDKDKKPGALHVLNGTKPSFWILSNVDLSIYHT